MNFQNEKLSKHFFILKNIVSFLHRIEKAGKKFEIKGIPIELLVLHSCHRINNHGFIFV